MTPATIVVVIINVIIVSDLIIFLLLGLVLLLVIACRLGGRRWWWGLHGFQRHDSPGIAGGVGIDPSGVTARWKLEEYDYENDGEEDVVELVQTPAAAAAAAAKE